MSLLVGASKSLLQRLASQVKVRTFIKMATYEQVKDIPNHPEVYLIDVRNEDELKKTGSIPASLNIPLPDLSVALVLECDKFQSAYGRNKPTKDTKIIFTCQSGRRALEANKIAKGAGYVNTHVYDGSWNDWAKREGLA
ncbi:rhodanese domain-containing protein CG4456 isoform X1 [Drosophila tropicalis]|uniref:rhodanese domain-containing protein CG4456 isoform X1 n=1 Tax=Drosophila tropicalis TaxID=46794 RepID=UPI0035AB6875